MHSNTNMSVEQPNPGPSRLSTGNHGTESTLQSEAHTNEDRTSGRKQSAGTLLTQASDSSPSRASARSEAGAKMRAALSAASSSADSGAAQATPASQQPSATGVGAASAALPASNHLGVPGIDTLPQRSPTSSFPRAPLTFGSEALSDLPGTVASDTTPIAANGSAAPFMSTSGRTASASGSSSGPSGKSANYSANGRARSSTSGIGSHTSTTMAPPISFSSSSSQSTRSSPRLRAQANQHPPSLPSLGGMSASAAAPPGSFSVSHHSSGHQNTMSAAAYERHTAELTNCIIAFLSPILPTEEEYRIKEATRRQLERLASKVSPGAKLLAFGSMANGFALRNSDMDLCCLIGKKDGQPTTNHTASELVEILSQLIREETDFNVMPLPKARIPIIKISRPPTPELPYEISCDIGFENRLALENTRLLLSYAMVDPPRLRTLVLFLKVWTKRRKLNSPYTGTLSSYGYTLLALYFLTHVKRPAVLPNLQRIPPTRPLKPEELELNGHNIYFYDDVATLRKEWTSQNTENVGELLIEFFRYFSKEFSYSKDVISLRTEGGLLSKDSKNWNAELCIEDPFQMGYNVSRTVTKDGLYTIRGEFMRASRILMNPKSQRVSALIAELCEEREDGLSRAPDGPYPRPRYQNAGAGVDGRSYRDVYVNPRRYDAPAFSGYGGSFAFEQMARGLGQGVAFPPSTAMLAPLSRTHGLSPKPQPPRFANQQEKVISSGQSDTGPPSSYDSFSRASLGHASARTSPSFKHALPGALHPSSGPNAQEAFAYGAEISFGPEPVSTTRDDTGGPRTKTARSLSESLNRSKSLPRAPAAVNGDGTARNGSALPSSVHPPYMSPGIPTGSDDVEGQMANLSVQPAAESTRRLSNSSHASSSILSEGANGGAGQYYSTSPTWSMKPRRGSQSTFHHHPHPHGHTAPAQHPYPHPQQSQQPYAYHLGNHHPLPPHQHQQQQQQQVHHLQQDQQQRQQYLGHHHQQQQQQHSSKPQNPSQQQPLQQKVQDTRAMLQEYLRRASENADVDVRSFAVDNDEDAGSVISEATLDELARISAIEAEDGSSPQLAAVSSEKATAKHRSPRSSVRLPGSIIQQAKNRRKAEQEATAAAAIPANDAKDVDREEK
ncbi:hypothetical protein ACQY0O_001317 [Thecaphora frezii]